MFEVTTHVTGISCRSTATRDQHPRLSCDPMLLDRHPQQPQERWSASLREKHCQLTSDGIESEPRNRMRDEDRQSTPHPSTEEIMTARHGQAIDILRRDGNVGKDCMNDSQMSGHNCNHEHHHCNHQVSLNPIDTSSIKLVSQVKHHHPFRQESNRAVMHRNWCAKFSTRSQLGHKRVSYSTMANLSQRILTTIFIYAILDHLSRYSIQSKAVFHKTQHQRQQILRIFPSFVTVVSAAAAPAQENTMECRTENDCEDPNRICHESKCICKRERPIDDKGMCLPLAVVGELCSVNDQCLGNSACIDNICACATNTISLFNPSTQIFYCHPKRGLYGECSHDAQCPNNAFCSTDKRGCLCQNGYGPATVKSADGVESTECLPKRCSSSRDCESEFHSCEDNRCLCLATHFDPHTAECYKFGSTGGKVDGVDQLTRPGSRNATGASLADHGSDNGGGFTRTVKDLMKNSDMLWIVVIILALLTLLLLTLMIMIVRKYYLGYCWTAHKKEYEPNNENGPAKAQSLSRNSIDNKSFRKKTNDGDTTDDDDEKHAHDDTAADRSNLVTVPNASTIRTTTTTTTTTATVKAAKIPAGVGSSFMNGKQTPQILNGTNGRVQMNGLKDIKDRCVKVDMRAPATGLDGENGQDSPTHSHDFANGFHGHQQQLLNRPLATSTSTPV